MHHSLLLFEANKGITFVWSQYWTSKSRHWLNFIWLHINKSTKISKSFQGQGWIVFTNYWMVGVWVVLMYLEQLGLSNIYTIIGHRKAIRIWFQPRACGHAMCVCAPAHPVRVSAGWIGVAQISAQEIALWSGWVGAREPDFMYVILFIFERVAFK